MTQTECRELFDYREGALYWRSNRGSNAKAGANAGRVLRTGYRSIHVSGRRHQEHRLVYLWWHGSVPTQLDHINGMKADNRIENLRPADPSRNQINTPQRKSASGIRGVRASRHPGKWIARIYQNNKEIRIGTFESKDEAKAAYKQMAREIYGEFVPSYLAERHPS